MGGGEGGRLDSAGGWGGGGDRQSNQTSYLFDKGGGVGDDQGVVDLELGEELGVVACWVGWSEWVGGLGGWVGVGGWVGYLSRFARCS